MYMRKTVKDFPAVFGFIEYSDGIKEFVFVALPNESMIDTPEQRKKILVGEILEKYTRKGFNRRILEAVTDEEKKLASAIIVVKHNLQFGIPDFDSEDMDV